MKLYQCLWYYSKDFEELKEGDFMYKCHSCDDKFNLLRLCRDYFPIKTKGLKGLVS